MGTPRSPATPIGPAARLSGASRRPLRAGISLVGAIVLLIGGAALATAAGAASPGVAQAEPIEGVGPGIHVVRGSDLASASDPGRRGEPRAPGDTAPQASPRIVGGSDAAITSWPWQVSIGIHPALAPEASAFDRHLCGGTLVAPTIVISAAHCLLHEGEFLQPEVFQVVTGRTQLSTGAGQTHDLVDYYLFADASNNPLYNPETGEWDVVFMELTPGSSSGTILIAGPSERTAWGAGSAAHITGWGATAEEGPGSDVLQQAQIAIIADSICGSPEVYGTAFSPAVMVCAGVLAGGVDACQGDSGGPLVVAIGGGFRLAGNTSWGVGCAQPNRPGVYARLAADPIRSALQEAILEVAGVNVVGPPGSRPPATGPSPALRVTINPRRARVKRGGRRAFRVRVRNSGDLRARNVRVCVRGPKRKIRVRGRACRPLKAISPGKASTRRFRVEVRQRASGRFALRVRVRAANHPSFTERARARIAR